MYVPCVRIKNNINNSNMSVFLCQVAAKSCLATLCPPVYRKSKASMMTSVSPAVSLVDSPDAAANQLLASDSATNQTSGTHQVVVYQQLRILSFYLH